MKVVFFIAFVFYANNFFAQDIYLVGNINKDDAHTIAHSIGKMFKKLKTRTIYLHHVCDSYTAHKHEIINRFDFNKNTIDYYYNWINKISQCTCTPNSERIINNIINDMDRELDNAILLISSVNINNDLITGQYHLYNDIIKCNDYFDLYLDTMNFKKNEKYYFFIGYNEPSISLLEPATNASLSSCLIDSKAYFKIVWTNSGKKNIMLTISDLKKKENCLLVEKNLCFNNTKMFEVFGDTCIFYLRTDELLSKLGNYRTDTGHSNNQSLEIKISYNWMGSVITPVKSVFYISDYLSGNK